MSESTPEGRIRALIVDDEAHARRTLRGVLEADPDIEIVGECWGADTPAGILATDPDLVLLDIEMPRMNGFDVLAALPPDRVPLVVFVTAYDEHAARAFEVRAIDYVLKPFTDARLAEAVTRAKRALRTDDLERFRTEIRRLLKARNTGLGGSEPRAAPSGPGERGEERLVFQDGSRTYLLDRHRIDWIEAVGSYVRVHAGDVSRLVRGTLGALEEELRDAGFFRIHRSALVNLGKVSELRHHSHGDYLVVLDDGTRLKLSRTRREEFEERTGLSL